MRISDWSSDVCSSDLRSRLRRPTSKSITTTFLPRRARPHARLALLVVLPTPPLPDVTTMISAKGFLRDSCWWWSRGIVIDDSWLAIGYRRTERCARPRSLDPLFHGPQIGRASCRERVCQYV